MKILKQLHLGFDVTQIHGQLEGLGDGYLQSTAGGSLIPADLLPQIFKLRKMERIPVWN